MAVTMAYSARPGKVLVDGDGRRPARLGFRFGVKLEPGRKNPMLLCVVKLLYGAGTRLVTTSSEEGLPAPRRRRSRLGAVLHARDEDEDDPLQIFLIEEVCWAGVGPCWWATAGLLRTWLLGCSLGCGAGKVQVDFSLLSSFSVLFSVFNSSFYNSNLNLPILQVLNNWSLLSI
jgi:hypothetical protein